VGRGCAKVEWRLTKTGCEAMTITAFWTILRVTSLGRRRRSDEASWRLHLTRYERRFGSKDRLGASDGRTREAIGVRWRTVREEATQRRTHEIPNRVVLVGTSLIGSTGSEGLYVQCCLFSAYDGKERVDARNTSSPPRSGICQLILRLNSSCG
jgi:hypothetical protein